jgi:hypothetical protein
VSGKPLRGRPPLSRISKNSYYWMESGFCGLRVPRHLAEFPCRHIPNISETALVAVDDLVAEAGDIANRPILVAIVGRNIQFDVALDIM